MFHLQKEEHLMQVSWSVPVCFGLDVEHSYKESCSFNKYHSLKENIMHVILKLFDSGEKHTLL